jgi:hypothetical protein
MSGLKRIKKLLERCTPAEREKLFHHLRKEIALHPLETQLHTKAEIILEAIKRAGGLTLRMMRGVLAEAAFEVEVVERLKGWKKMPVTGDPAYGFLLKDRKGGVRVQVKLQRSKRGHPWRANEASTAFRSLPGHYFVVETQKTRGGKKKKTGAATRPYRFGEFDVLAVAMYPSTSRWDTFMYTVTDWLLPGRTDPAEILKYQPVASIPDEDWTNDFHIAVSWLRSGTKKTISEGRDE